MEFQPGDEIELLHGYLPELPNGSKGKVVEYNKRGWLVIDWGKPVMVNSGCGWPPEYVCLVGGVVENSTFCVCKSTNVVWNSTLGQKFLYCRSCKKERKP